MLFDILRQLLLLPPGEPSARVRYRRWAAFVHPRELVRQRNAERFHIGASGSTWILQLRLELEGGCPNVRIEKEQSWPEVDLGKAKFGQQRTQRVDVEEGAAQQGTRFLPAIEPVPRRNESHPPIPLATVRPR